MYSLSSETKLHLNNHQIVLLIPLKKDQKLIFRLQPSRALAFHLSVGTLLLFTLQHLEFTFINSTLSPHQGASHLLCFSMVQARE